MSWKNNNKLSELLDKIFTNQRVGWIYAANSAACAVYGAITKEEINWLIAGLCFIMAVVFWATPEE